MLTRDNFKGPWAGLPVAWTDTDQFDEQTYRDDVVRCCQAKMPGIYTGGTTGEFYAMEFDEFREVTRVTIEACKPYRVPVMIGCTSTYTRGVLRRVEIAREFGADAIQVAVPYWLEVGESQLLPFFREIAAAAGDMSISLYDSSRTKNKFTVDQHLAIKDAVPQYLMIKSNAGTVGTTPEGCEVLSEHLNVFVGEHLWADLGPHGAIGCCSAMVYWNPTIILRIWRSLEQREWAALRKWNKKLERLYGFLMEQYVPKGFVDTAFDRMGGRASGFLKTSLNNRGPYPSATEEDVQILRYWYENNFPEMLKL